MKKKRIAWIMAIVASLSLATPVAAASRGNGRMINYVDANGDGICDYYTQANKNGTCGYCNGNIRYGRRFVDKNGDGICDYFTGNGSRSGRRCGRGRNMA